ncbi:halo transducer protein [Halobellus sp. Atlit-31R]|nr:halo transducer protein [Halobellus sp. Atlit-31R]
MTRKRPDRDDGVVGLSTDEAVEAIADADPDRDPETVRSVLDHVTDDDGAVTQGGIDETVSDTSKMLATAETRAELARMELDDARAAAAGVEDVDLVRRRLERYESTLDDVETRVRELGVELQSVSSPDDDPDDVYESVLGLRRVASNAQTVQQRADELQMDVEEFQTWLTTPDQRRSALEEDVDAVAQALENIEVTDDSDADDWVDAVLRADLVGLLVADVRAELEDHRALNEWSDAGDWLGEIEDRLDSIESQAAETRDDLDAVANPAWRDRHGDRIDAFAETLESVDPPVPWGEIRSELDRARSLDEDYPASS